MSPSPAPPAHRTAGRLGVIAVGIAAALLVSAPNAGARAKPNKYNVKVTYEALSSWTHNVTYTNPSPQPGDCTSRIDDGHGQDTVEASDTVLMYAQKGYLATLDVSDIILSSHTRTGTMTHDGEGAPDCDNYDETEPTSGCGSFGLETTFPQLTLTGKSLTNVSLDWGSADPTPDFNPCPFFGGYDADQLFPQTPYLDFTFIELPRNALKKGKRVVKGEASKSRGVTQTCGTIEGGCSADTVHNASAMLDVGVEVVFTRKGPKH
jgi:hypothetical protein